jgi:4-hydroxy-3-methylbut-2-enyl diphosphate reductase
MNALRITVSKDAGFCSGVRRAIELARKAAKDYGEVAMLGDIVHNEKVVADLEKLGVKVYSNLDDIPDNMPILFRSHGTSVQTWEKAQQRGLVIIDATCPLVREIHQHAKLLEDEGRRVVIIGDHGHDEVRGIASYLQKPVIIANAKDAAELSAIRRAGIVIQSTQFIDNVNSIIAELIPNIFDLRIINTICKPTRNRQTQLQELAGSNDVMIIIGSFTSANTKRLTTISKQLNPRSYQIQESADLKTEWFVQAHTVGISAGASTPDEIVADVVKNISDLPL